MDYFFLRKDAVRLREPKRGEEGKEKKTEPKAVFYKTTATTTRKKQILFGTIREVCAGGRVEGRGGHANDNNLIDIMKTNVYKVHSLVAPCTRRGGGVNKSTLRSSQSQTGNVSLQLLCTDLHTEGKPLLLV